MKYSLSNPLFQEATSVMQRIESHGYEAYFVGGCVRDTLLNLPIHDIDIASSATPDEIEAIFPATIDLGKQHGTVIVIWQNETYEITTFRTEASYSDFRHPDHVTFVRSLEEDTLRRDFTVNALAFDVNGHLFDYHGGVADLDDQLIRAVGIPSERFEEDALRIFRAVRFASQLGFDIEAKTFKAMASLAYRLEKISMERLRIEMTKFLLGSFFPQKYKLLTDSGIHFYLPKFKLDNFEDTLGKLANMYEKVLERNGTFSEEMTWALLLKFSPYQTAKEVKNVLKVWTHSNQTIKNVLMILQLFPIFEEDRLTILDAYFYDKEILIQLEELFAANSQAISRPLNELFSELPIKDQTELVVNGSDIMRFLDLKKGNQQVGELLGQIEEQVVLGKLANNQTAIKAFVERQMLK